MPIDAPQTWHVYEDAGALLLARVLDWDGNLLTQAAVTSITYKCFDLTTGAETGTGTLNKATVIYDTAQTGGNWPYTDGYNFRHMLAATCLPTGGHSYRVEVKITPASGEAFWIVYERLAGHAVLTS